VPLRRRRRIGPGTAQTFLAFLAALVFLLALFTPVSESENHRPVLDYHPALEILLLAAALALLGLVGGRLPRLLRGLLAGTVLAAALLHLADALMPGLFGAPSTSIGISAKPPPSSVCSTRPPASRAPP